MRRRLGLFQLLAVLIPLAGAGLVIGVGPEQFTPSAYRTFRVLVAALMALGVLGLGVALAVSSTLGRTLAALTGPDRASRPRPDRTVLGRPVPWPGPGAGSTVQTPGVSPT